jgi:hypothetical protein
MLMKSTIRRLVTLAALFTVVTRCGAADEPLTRVQIGRMGKAATALVEVKAARGQGSGSAFCIHKDGWFLTNAHVAQGELTLVLNPSLRTEKSYSARVVRSDPELDLALLRVEGVKDLPALALGSDEGLEELADVVAFGFPFGTSLRAVSVNPGSITALRHKDGRLHRIQLDVVLNPGNSGGPVLDGAGKVIGVVESGIVVSAGATPRGVRPPGAPTGVNFAIPVSLVSRFLARPEVQFSPPRLGSPELHKAVTFEARVTPVLPSTERVTVDLILKAGNGPERTARMEADGDRYRLTAVPIPGRSGPLTLRLLVRFGEGTLEATTTDRTFTAGGREVALADVRTIWPGSPARVSLRDGTMITGALSGLDAVPMPVGTQTLSVRLDGAKVVEVTPVGPVERVACTLVVRQGEKEVFWQSESLGTAGLVKMVEAGRFQGHRDCVTTVVVSPDGRRLLSCSLDRTMILWDRETGQELRRFREQGGRVESVAISPDGRRALSGGQDTIVRLWDLESGDVIREFRGHSEYVFCVAFSPDGRLAYSTSGGSFTGEWRDGTDSAIRVWDVETGRELRRLNGNRGIVWSVAVSRDGRRVLAGGSDGTLILWDSETGAEIRRFGLQGRCINSVAFLPDCRRAVSASGEDKTISLWDVETGWEIDRFRGHTDGVTWLAVSPDGGLLFSSSYRKGELILWDVDSRKQVDKMSWGNVPPTRGCFTPDGRQIVWAGDDRLLRLYRLAPTGESAPSASAVIQLNGSVPASSPGVAPAPPGEPTPSVPSGTLLNGSLLGSLSQWTRPVAGVSAILGLVGLLCARRRPRWVKSGWRWPLGCQILSTEASASECPPAFRSRFLRLGKPRAPEASFMNSDLAVLAGDHPEMAPDALGFNGVATGAAASTVHPDAAILGLFAAGRLRSSEMERLSEHVAECPVCLEVLEQLPEDSMVRLLQDRGHQIDGPLGEPGASRAQDVGPDGFLDEEPHPVPPSGGPVDNPRYELKTLIGRGGMGLVYLADDHREGRPVVLKFLREDLLDHPRLVDRFRREAAAATFLKHPNIVEAYGAEPFGRWPALAMEYIRGTDLARLIERTGPVPVRVGCELIRQAALGLQYSFERGMVHRDIKPSNLMVSSDGTVKILDFGLAKMQSELSIDAGLTSTGAFLGSVDYMAPEQADDPRLADIRADIYSLGCTFYHLLSGAPPFQGTTLEVLGAHRSLKAPPLNERRPEVSPELAVLVAGMMAREPGRRFQMPGQVAMALMTFPEAQGGALASSGPAA